MQNKVRYFTNEIRDLIQYQAISMLGHSNDYEKGYYDALKKIADLISIYKLEETDEKVPDVAV